MAQHATSRRRIPASIRHARPASGLPQSPLLRSMAPQQTQTTQPSTTPARRQYPAQRTKRPTFHTQQNHPRKLQHFARPHRPLYTHLPPLQQPTPRPPPTTGTQPKPITTNIPHSSTEYLTRTPPKKSPQTRTHPHAQPPKTTLTRCPTPKTNPQNTTHHTNPSKHHHHRAQSKYGLFTGCAVKKPYLFMHPPKTSRN